MPSDLHRLLATAMSHAVRYREVVAADPQPLKRDYHTIRDSIVGPVPEAGAEAGARCEPQTGDGQAPQPIIGRACPIILERDPGRPHVDLVSQDRGRT